MAGDDIGIVVIGRNEGKRLIDCLGSIPIDASCMTYVDSGSTDDSLQAASRFGVSTVDLTGPYTAARARNEGFAALKKRRPHLRFVQFIDGDCRLDPRWLDMATDFIKQRDDVAIVCGRRRECDPSSSVYNRLCDIEWDTPVGEASWCGGDLLVRADAFAQVHGFNAQLIAGEEPELCLRLREAGWRIWRLDADMTYHDAAIRRFSQWWVRTVRGGYAMAEVSKLHWRSPVGIWRLELFRAILFGGLLPGLICAAALIQPLAVAALLLYIAQVCRIGIVRQPHAAEPWAYAAFVTLAKFAEFQGVVKFYWRQLRHRPIELIEYK